MRVKNKLLLSIMRNIVIVLIISSLIAIALTGCGEKAAVDEPSAEAEDITSEGTANEITPGVDTEEESLPPADSNIGGLLDEVSPENEYLRSYFDDMEVLLDSWRDEEKFGINKLGFDLTLPRIDIVTATDSDAEALKNELVSMGDYSEGIPYYNEDVIRITIGEHFPDDMR